MEYREEEKEIQSKEKENDKEINNENNNKEEEDESSSHESIFYEDDSLEKKEEKEEEKNNNNNILNIILGKKKKRELSNEQKEERIKRNIERYCKRNDKMLELLEKINNNETTKKNINEMMRLLAIDLSDTKKLTNKKALISQKKEEMFNRLLDLTFEEYQLFWFKLTQGKYKKGNAQLINTGNMRDAKLIYDKIIEERNNKEKSVKKKEKTVREIINFRDNMEIENEKFDDVFLRYDPDISSDDEDSLDSSEDESFSESDESNKKLEKEKLEKEKEEKEKIRKEEIEREKEREKEQKEKNEKMKKLMDKEDEIDIFN